MSFRLITATNSRGDGPRPILALPLLPEPESGPIPMAAPLLLPYVDSVETPACAEPDCDAQPERTSATTANSTTIACHPRPLMAPPFALCRRHRRPARNKRRRKTAW